MNCAVVSVAIIFLRFPTSNNEDDLLVPSEPNPILDLEIATFECPILY